MSLPRHPLEHQGVAIGQDDDGGWNPGDPVAPEALRILFMPGFAE